MDVAGSGGRGREAARGRGAARGRAFGAALLVVVLVAASAAAGCTPSTLEGAPALRTLDWAIPRADKVPADEATSQAGLALVARPKVEASVPVSASETASPVPFPIERAMVYTRHLADKIGVRAAGSRQERMAANYVELQLERLGYEPRIEEFTLPNNKHSRNVIAVKPGTSRRTLVLGAHLDSKPPSPGANDNAAGVGALLAMASVLSRMDTSATVEFAFFGSEEIIGADTNQHHFGSRYHVTALSDAEKDLVAGMISLDLIAVGDELYARSMKRGPQTLVNDLLAFSSPRLPMAFKWDPGETGMSDHEPYEMAGIPAVWVESLPDPAYHKTTDVSSHLDVKRLRDVGQLVLDYVVTRSVRDLARLRE